MNRLTLPIEVGKKYVRRDGSVVTALEYVNQCAYVRKEGHGCYLVGLKDGLRQTSGETHTDLVADYVEQSKAHPHAASMLLYAQDAAETEEPWLRWQFRLKGCDWESPQIDSLVWNPFTEYRRKPKTIRIGEFDVPEPLRVAPDKDTSYWLPDLLGPGGARRVRRMWSGCEQARVWLAQGLVHASPEAAELHAQALLSLSAP